MSTQPVLIAGQWRAADATGTFSAEDPARQEPLAESYPVSSWKDCDAALTAAQSAAEQIRRLGADVVADFLEKYADRIEARKDEIVAMAQQETALPASPRLADVELPRTTNQLRLAAAAARERSWTMATIDTQAGIRSYYAAIGPVCVFGPNNFPLAFNSISGGDFAAAIAAGNPVIGKANSSHPGTTRLLAEEAQAAAEDAGLPAGSVQLLYRTSHEDGERLVADPRVGATGYTGSRTAGLKLKAAADRGGKPIYLELSSVNPVVVLPGALRERREQIVQQFTTSCLMGTGQFCTNPGIVLLLAGDETEKFISDASQAFSTSPVGTLLGEGVAASLGRSVQKLLDSGAELVVGNAPGGGKGHSFANTLLRVDGKPFLADPEAMQTEAFGNESLFVVAENADQARDILRRLEGNLTGCVYSDTGGSDDDLYAELAGLLRQRVGRLLNDKMPTGVAVSPAMNHGGPFPATDDPASTAVGIPASLNRFAMLQCFDNVRPHRLPPELQDPNPTGKTWRRIDGQWTQGNVGS